MSGSVVLPYLPPALAFVRAEASVCRACPLGATARSTVVYRGDPEPVVLFVGQSPGDAEDELGIPFVGPSGRLLDEMIAAAPFPTYGITNAVLHHPPGNRYRYDHGVACEPFLRRIVEIVDPLAIVAVGRDANLALVSIRPELPKFFIYHPSYILHGAPRSEWSDQWTSLRFGVKNLVRSAKPVSRPPEEEVPR